MKVEVVSNKERGGLSGSHVRMSEDRAYAVLRDHYGLKGTLTRFDTEKDDTFRVRTGTRSFVLKIANPDEHFEEIDFQNGLLNHVGIQNPDLPVPRLLPALNGQHMSAMTDVDGSERHIRMLTFLEGTPLDQTHSNPQERMEIGKILAHLRLASEGFSHPGAERCYPWDVQHLLQQEQLLNEVEDAGQRAALEQGLDRFRALEARVRACRQQVLHNDFSKSNIVVDHDNPAFVTGIIDFGDAVKTAIAIDVATALLNQLPETPHEDLFHRGRDVLQGYLEITELTDEELALIPHLVMARVVVRALLTLWRARLFPENQTYILRNTEQGWHQLDWFLSRSPDEVSGTLMSFAGRKGKHR